MKKIMLTAYLLCAVLCASAQYTTYGKISYERKTNVHQQMEAMLDNDDDRSWVDNMKKMQPKFSVTYFEYSFNDQYALYKPGKESETKLKGWGTPPAYENTVFTDFKKEQVTAYKEVYEERFLVQDSMRKLQWKIQDEIRMIANYKCRKATARMYDSVVIVAFYTDDIIASGGPELFGGLPGMILEIAIPRLNTTWIATNIEWTVPKPEELKAPDKGKKVTQQELYADLNKSVSKWGKWGQRSIWWSML